MIAAAALIGAVAWRLVADKPSSSTAAKPNPPATVAKVVKEEALATVTLTDEAEKRIGVKVAPVERKSLPRTRVYGGETMVPVGRMAIVAAPLAGVVKAPPEGMKAVGRNVKKGEAILLLSPILSPEARTTLSAQLVEAEGQENTARANQEAATIALERARRLLRDEAGSRRNVDEAQAAYDSAMKIHEAAAARKNILVKLAGELQSGTAAPLHIDAPDDGLVRNMNAVPGQMVASGATLFEIVNLQTMWVRVPVPVGDMDELAYEQAAQVGPLIGPANAPKSAAKPIAAPPSANAQAGTVDVYFELANSKGAFHPGERLGVEVPLKGSGESLAVPAGAIAYDIHGNAWLFEQTAPHTFVRRRADVHHVVNGVVALANGPKVGASIVVEGAIELFAAETGFIK